MTEVDKGFLYRVSEAALEEIRQRRTNNKIISGANIGTIELGRVRVVGVFEELEFCATFDCGEEKPPDDPDINPVIEATIMALDRNAWPDQAIEEAPNDVLAGKATVDGRVIAAGLSIGRNARDEEVIILFHSPFISPGTAVAILQNTVGSAMRPPSGSKKH